MMKSLEFQRKKVLFSLFLVRMLFVLYYFCPFVKMGDKTGGALNVKTWRKHIQAKGRTLGRTL